MTTDYNQECIRLSREIRLLQSEANILRQAKLQNDEPLPDDPADWLLGVESDQSITDQLLAIGREVALLQSELLKYRRAQAIG